MKFAGLKLDGIDQIGAVEGDAIIPLVAVSEFYRDLSRWCAEATKRREDARLSMHGVRLVPGIPPGARVLCVGLNYRAHAAEGGFVAPEYPAIFGRWTQSLSADGDLIPALDDKLDWECELGVVIGREMADVSPQEAMDGVFGYAPFNDISARTYQRHTHQWTPGKNMDRSGPVGTIVTADEVGDPALGLRIRTELNGREMQSATTADMIFSVGEIISYLSQIMTLQPGDFIATGTPEGVGHARKPPLFMKPGDVIAVSIEKVGQIENRIVDASLRRDLMK